MSNDGIKDTQTAAADGRLLRELIDGVQLHEMQNIITRNGTTTCRPIASSSSTERCASCCSTTARARRRRASWTCCI